MEKELSINEIFIRKYTKFEYLLYQKNFKDLIKSSTLKKLFLNKEILFLSQEETQKYFFILYDEIKQNAGLTECEKTKNIIKEFSKLINPKSVEMAMINHEEKKKELELKKCRRKQKEETNFSVQETRIIRDKDINNKDSKKLTMPIHSINKKIEENNLDSSANKKPEIELKNTNNPYIKELPNRKRILDLSEKIILNPGPLINDRFNPQNPNDKPFICSYYTLLSNPKGITKKPQKQKSKKEQMTQGIQEVNDFVLKLIQFSKFAKSEFEGIGLLESNLLVIFIYCTLYRDFFYNMFINKPQNLKKISFLNKKFEGLRKMNHPELLFKYSKDYSVKKLEERLCNRNPWLITIIDAIKHEKKGKLKL